MLSSFGLNALSLSLSLKIRCDNRKSDERPKPRMYYLGYENDALDFFLGDRRLLFVCRLFVRFVLKSCHAHTSRARYYHISLKEFKNTIIEEKELYYHE